MASKNNPDNRVKLSTTPKKWYMIMPGKRMVYERDGKLWDKNDREVK